MYSDKPRYISLMDVAQKLLFSLMMLIECGVLHEKMLKAIHLY